MSTDADHRRQAPASFPLCSVVGYGGSNIETRSTGYVLAMNMAHARQALIRR